jgi:hypothetical protein
MTVDSGTPPPAAPDPDGPSARSGLPVVVIGAGPVGLAAGASLLEDYLVVRPGLRRPLPAMRREVTPCSCSTALVAPTAPATTARQAAARSASQARRDRSGATGLAAPTAPADAS